MPAFKSYTIKALTGDISIIKSVSSYAVNAEIGKTDRYVIQSSITMMPTSLRVSSPSQEGAAAFGRGGSTAKEVMIILIRCCNRSKGVLITAPSSRGDANNVLELAVHKSIRFRHDVEPEIEFHFAVLRFGL